MSNQSNLLVPTAAAVVAPVVAAATMSDKNAQTAPSAPSTPASALAPATPAPPIRPAPSAVVAPEVLPPAVVATAATVLNAASMSNKNAPSAPAQAPAAPVQASAPTSAPAPGVQPSSTAAPVQAPASTPAPAPVQAPAPQQIRPAPAPTQIINKEAIQNAINTSLQKYPLEITDEKGGKYNMKISSNFSNSETPDVPIGASPEFKSKISNIQAAINNAVSCIKTVDAGNTPLKLNMKVTVTPVNQSGGGNKKMRQTKKMKKRTKRIPLSRIGMK